MLVLLLLQLNIRYLENNLKIIIINKYLLLTINYNKIKLFVELLSILQLLLLEIKLINLLIKTRKEFLGKVISLKCKKHMFVLVWENASSQKLCMMEWRYVEKLAVDMASHIILGSFH